MSMMYFSRGGILFEDFGGIVGVNDSANPCVNKWMVDSLHTLFTSIR